MKIYEYDEKERIVKIDDKTAYLTVSEDKLFRRLNKNNFEAMYIEDINQLLWRGAATNSFVKNFVKELENKLGIKINLKNYK